MGSEAAADQDRAERLAAGAHGEADGVVAPGAALGREAQAVRAVRAVVARGHWVQTPAFSFPVEPHALLPFAHWLPEPLRARYWPLGVSGEWEPELRLLRRAEVAALFPGSAVVAERLGPLAKSWIAVRAPGPRRPVANRPLRR